MGEDEEKEGRGCEYSIRKDWVGEVGVGVDSVEMR